MTSKREIERVSMAELFEALRHHAQTNTEWLERLGGQIVNHTLEVWSGAFGDTGYISLQWGVAAGSIYVRNLGVAEAGVDPHIVTVSAAGPSAGGSVPSGLGTALIPAGQGDTVPLASRQATIYGTPDDLVWFAAFTAGVRPVAGA